MRLPAPARSAAALLIVLAGLVPGAGVGSAQEPAPAETAAEPAPPPIRPIPIEDVPQRAEASAAELESMLASAVGGDGLQGFHERIDALKQDAAAGLSRASSVLASDPTVRQLQDLERKLVALQARLGGPDSDLDAAARPLGAALAKLDEMGARWQATEKTAREASAAQTTLNRIASVRREVDRVRGELVARRNEILKLRDALVDPKANVDRVLAQVHEEIASRLEGVFTLDRAPLWSPKVRQAVSTELSPGWSQPIVERLDEVGDYVRRHPSRLLLHAALFAVLALLLRALGGRARERADEHYDLREAELVFRSPISMAAVIALAFTPQIHSAAPYLFSQLVFTVVVFPAVLIVRKFAPKVMMPLVMGVPALFVLDRIRVLLESLPTVERLALVFEMVATLGFMLWLMHPSRFADIPTETLRSRTFRVLGRGLRIAVVAIALAIAAETLGFGIFADLVGRGTIRSIFAALLYYALLKVAQSLLVYALVLPPLSALNMVSRHRWLVRRRLDRGLVGLAVLSWAYTSLSVFGLGAPLTDAVRSGLAASLEVGALSVSLGDLLIFGLTAWLSLQLARLINVALEEDVFPRVRMARGVPYAISSLVRYTLIFFGFLVALAAAGIELSRLTVIVGGLGVGIGFGLQSVVNNFVSGLILLFERPFQVGDAIQIQGQNLWGQITRIGIRASVVRTWDGAEVIVPNGHLVSDMVTNWTLSNRDRRIQVAIGVEYGTDAQRVIDLLLRVAAENPRVLEDPAPLAFFMNFGDSALEFELRAWIGDFDIGFSVRSELSVAIQRALKEAGIGVPFPQRDLHLRSVSAEAASGLDRASGRSRGDG